MLPLSQMAVTDYNLFMYDDGEIETDLPPIKLAETLNRVGFQSLALVAKRAQIVTRMRSSSDERELQKPSITIYFTDATSERIDLTRPPSATTVEWIRAKAVDILNVRRPLRERVMARNRMIKYHAKCIISSLRLRRATRHIRRDDGHAVLVGPRRDS